MSVWVCGEVLMDVLAEGAVVGGGPANTAKALARLDHHVEFIGGISTDSFGLQIVEEMQEDGVGLNLSHTSTKPTATAQVRLDQAGGASYEFTIENTATFDFDREWLLDPSRGKPEALHIGSLATIVEPGEQTLFEWAMTVAEFAPVVFDPNVRTSYLVERARYAASVEKWISITAVVKASDDDIAWLYPGAQLTAVAKSWIDAGVEIVVITRGASGLMAVTAEEVIEIPGVQVKIVDTVGAGDTVGAVFVDAILEHGICNLRGELLRDALNCAALAAAITCSRAGAQPPTKREIQAMEKNRA